MGVQQSCWTAQADPRATPAVAKVHRPTSSHVIEAAPVDTTLPLLLPAGDLNADPQNPKPGDVFIDAVSGRRVQIIAREASTVPVATELQ
jgi:hypothetical protein